MQTKENNRKKYIFQKNIPTSMHSNQIFFWQNTSETDMAKTKTKRGALKIEQNAIVVLWKESLRQP